MNRLETKTDFFHTELSLAGLATHDIILTFSFAPVSIEMIYFYCAYTGGEASNNIFQIQSITFDGYTVIVTIKNPMTSTTREANTGVIVTAAG